eukprot:7277005-Prymnesium_polylepis.1
MDSSEQWSVDLRVCRWAARPYPTRPRAPLLVCCHAARAHCTGGGGDERVWRGGALRPGGAARAAGHRTYSATSVARIRLGRKRAPLAHGRSARR